MTDIKDTLAALSEAATDADREAAAVLYDALFPHNDLRATNIRLGNIDDGTAVQAFAAHRRNVITEAIRTGQLVPVPSVERVLTDTAAHLAAAISLLERGGKAAKKAAPSDRMFDQMMLDYKASLERARKAIAAMKERRE